MVDEGQTFLCHLGLGKEFEWGEPVLDPAPVLLPASLSEVASGNLHSLFLSSDGGVWSCGAGWDGPLGHGDESSLSVPRPISALAALKIERIAAGGAHSLAISELGGLWSWGWGRYGQLGHGDECSHHVPRHFMGMHTVRFVQVAAGDAHSLAACSRGHAYSFGRAEHGQCGHGGDSTCRPASNQLVPHIIAALEGKHVREVAAIGDLSAAVDSVDTLYTWGTGSGTVCEGLGMPMGPMPVPMAVVGGRDLLLQAMRSMGHSHECGSW